MAKSADIGKGGLLRQNQVTLPMTDYDRSVAFYRALGLVQIVGTHRAYARFECPLGDGGAPATVSLEQVDGWKGADWPLVYFEVDDMDATVERLAALGIHPDDPPEEASYLWTEMDMRDPAGNRLRIYKAARNRRFPPWRTEPEALENQAAWTRALTRAALPGAVRVRISRRVTPDGQSFRLASYDLDGHVVGDDRDYDLLKAAMSPLERLCEPFDGPVTAELDLATNILSVL